jgi:D-glycero-alpha-D-manno-heptose 1-phosphate guanylyltransferase
MVEINGQPFLDFIIKYSLKFGFGHFILCIGYMSDLIMNHYRRRKDLGRISFSVEKEPLGTAGAVKNAAGLIKTEPFMVMNGDSFCGVNLAAFLAFHQEKKSFLSMVVSQAENSGDYGALKTDPFDQIVEYREKANGGKAGINAGIYLFNRSVLCMIPTNRAYSLEYDLFPRLVGGEFYGFNVPEVMIDIGTPERLEEASSFLRGKEISFGPQSQLDEAKTKKKGDPKNSLGRP